MATVKLSNLNPVYLNHNLGIGTSNPQSKLHIDGGDIRLGHSNAGQGIQFRSTSATGNKTMISWYNNGGTELWRVILDEEGDNRNYLKFIAVGNTKPVLELRDDGKIIMASLPIENPNTDGCLWNDNGTLKISSGS